MLQNYINHILTSLAPNLIPLFKTNQKYKKSSHSHSNSKPHPNLTKNIISYYPSQILFLVKYYHPSVTYKYYQDMSNTKNRLFLITTVSLVILTIFIYTLGKERSHKLPHSGFMKIFETKTHEALISKLTSQQFTIVVGKDEDGVDVFVSYALNRTLSEDQTVNQRVLSTQHSDIQDLTYPLFSHIFNFISEKTESQGQTEVWVIDSNGPLTAEHMNALNQLVGSYPTDKVIVVAPEANIKSKIFKKLHYQRPSDEAIGRVLEQEGLTLQQIKMTLKNHHDNLEALYSSYNQGTLLSHQKAFQGEKDVLLQEMSQSSSKTLAQIKKICKYGKLPSKVEISDLSALQSVGYKEGTYYWFSQNYLLAYESVTGIDCETPQVFIEKEQPNQSESSSTLEDKKQEQQIKTDYDTSVEEDTDNHQQSVNKKNKKEIKKSKGINLQKKEEVQKSKAKKNPSKQQKNKGTVKKQKYNKERDDNTAKQTRKEGKKQTEKTIKQQKPKKHEKRSIHESVKKGSEKTIKKLQKETIKSQKKSKGTNSLKNIDLTVKSSSKKQVNKKPKSIKVTIEEKKRNK